jgi:predicted transcriptional regulator
MSKALSVKLRDDVFARAEAVRKRRRVPRNAYLNDAVALYNRLWERRDLAKILARESRLVAAESMAVLHEFERLEDEIPE